jgi:hypothetical protein
MESQDNKYDFIAEQEHKEVPVPEEKPTFLADDDWYSADVSHDFLDFTEPYRAPRYTLQRGDRAFANVGELHIISGKPGNGKTALMTMLMAAILSGRYGKLEYILKERPTPLVLYIDTEQGKDDTIALKNRVCSMAGIDYRQESKQFIILRLRDTEKETDRWRKILKAIWLVRPTDIFLDGILDLVKDYNDQVECQPIIRKCMMLANEYDTSLWMVLHENPLVSKLVGTLGSIAQRKVAEIFSVIKTKQCDLKPNEQQMNMPEIYFTVDQVKARGKDVDKWWFKYTDVNGWGMPEEIDGPQTVGDLYEEPAKTEPTPEEVENMVSVIGTRQNISLTTLREDMKKKWSIGSTKAKEYIDRASQLGILTVSDNKYTANPVERFDNDNYKMPF